MFNGEPRRRGTGLTGARSARSKPGRAVAAGVLGVVIAAALAGCFPVTGTKHTSTRDTSSPEPTISATGTASPQPTTQSSPVASPVPTGPAAPPNPADSRPATPEPVATPVVAPTISTIPQGTVVAQNDVASPKGSIHFHYRVVANGNGTYSVQYSDYRSTLPVPVSVTLLQIAPNVGDGLTYHGVGDHLLGGPTSAAAPLSTASLGGIARPSYLGALVTYSSASPTSGLPTEIGPGKVLAVNTIHWAIPLRQTNVHPVDHGAAQFASGAVTARTTTGAPRAYRVAPGDTTAVVAQRFGISIQDLIWLNAGLQVFGAQQYLYSGTTINLDPQNL